MNARPNKTTVIQMLTAQTSKDLSIVRVSQVTKEMVLFAQVRNIHK